MQPAHQVTLVTSTMGTATRQLRAAEPELPPVPPVLSSTLMLGVTVTGGKVKDRSLQEYAFLM